MKKVLIIEDDPNIAASLDVRFTANGYVTLLANDALHGTRLAVQSRPDLVVLDISMPAGNGLTLAANLKKLPETCDIPIIFITASKDPRLREMITGLGAAGFFEKPYEIEELLVVAQQTLSRKHVPSQPKETETEKWSRRSEKILIVEDDSKIAMALALRLKAAGYQTVLAFDAVLGLSAAIRTPPDLVLMDVSIPGGNGLDLAEKIQKLLPEPPLVICLTASKQPALRQKAQELGLAGFFEKPYEAEELMAAIQNALQSRHEPAGEPAL